MAEPCKKIKYKKRKSRNPVVQKREPPKTTFSDDGADDARDPVPYFFPEEAEEVTFVPPRDILQELRNWVRKQRFIPQDLSDEFLTVFLTGVGFDVESAAQKLEEYIYSRQKPSYLFRERDPFSSDNAKLFDKLYVLPIPETTPCGCKIILMGLIEPTATYNPLDHAKALAMVIDLLIWENDFGFGEFIVVFDGRNFICPQLLERKVNDHRSITSLLLDTIPGTLRSFYFFRPPAHVAHVADTRNELWITVVRNEQEMIGYLPADMLPMEFGGNLGHVEELLEQWYRHLAQARAFFIHFELKMINDYRRRICHEREVSEGGRSWVHNMKLWADEWDYKIRYYDKMTTFRLPKRPGFGKDRQRKLRQQKLDRRTDPLAKCRELLRREAEENLVFEPTYLYNGYARQMRKPQKEEQQLQKKLEFQRCLSLHPFLQPEVLSHC